jgi:ankyrin repeat protein
MTALHLAIEADSLPVVLKLIEKGAICTVTRKSDGFTPLFCAVKKGHVDVIKAMYAKAVSLETLLDSGKSVLHIASENGQLACLRYLLDQGLDVDAITHDGNSAIMLAIKAGFIETAKELAFIAKPNQVNQQKQTASLLAIKYSMSTVSDILIERGEDPELMDDKGYNYIYYLVRNGEAQSFFALVEANKVNLSLTYQGDTILKVAAKYRQFLIVFPLLEKNLLPKTQGLSLLDYAIIADEIGYVRRNAENSTPKLVQLAAHHGSIRCLTWLLKKNGLSTNHLLESIKAALEHSNNPKAIELLVQRLPDVNQALDAKGNTALHLAASIGSRLVIESLLSFGCDIQLRNNDGQTAFHIAVAQEDNWLLKRLLKLTKPSEWTADLWQPSAIKPTTAIAKTLAFYRKRLPAEAKTDFAVPVNQQISTELPTLIMTEALTEGLQKLEYFFEEANYEEAIDYLEENSNLLVLFKSRQGAHLFKTLFSNIHDNSKLTASLEKDKSEELTLALSPDNLLILLKNKGINPALFTGENNVILSIVRVKSDKNAMYCLNFFTRHFLESVVPLAMDNFSKKMRVIEYAIKLNKLSLFKTLIGHCTLSNSPALPTLHGLHEAVLSNNYELVQDTLEYYPANSLNQKKQTPLMLAASLDNVRIMELLLAHEANPDQVDGFGQNALHHALHHKAQSAALCILPLLKLKNQSDRHGITPLMLAASKGIVPILRFLCEQGDFSESLDHKGWSALHYAGVEGQVESAVYLVTQGFAMDAVENPESPKKSERCQKRTPLHLAALRGHTELVRQFIRLGAKIEQEDANQQSAFEYGVKSKSIEMLQCLQEHPLYHSKDRNTQLLLAATVVDNEEVVSQLILDDVNCNASDESGCTALHLAAMTNAGKVASLILQGGDVALDISDQRMRTPLHYAAQFGHVWLIELLCEAGANINYHNNITPTALFIASEQGKTGAVAALLKYKADVSISNKDGLTPLEVAALNGHQEIVKSLECIKNKQVEPVAGLLIRNGIYRQAVPQCTIAATNSLSLGQ